MLNQCHVRTWYCLLAGSLSERFLGSSSDWLHNARNMWVTVFYKGDLPC